MFAFTRVLIVMVRGPRLFLTDNQINIDVATILLMIIYYICRVSWGEDYVIPVADNPEKF